MTVSTARCCLECGASLPEEIQRGALLARTSPYEVFWGGVRIPLQPAQARIVALLARRPGWVGHAALELLSEQASNGVAAAKVHIHFIRKRFREQNIPVQIENRFGFGYRLVVEGEPHVD